jgi:hypothetical protein
MISVTLAISMLAAGCSYKFLFWERNIWQDTYGIFTMVEPADLELYRELLPASFSMPDQPMVGVYLVHFVDTEPWPMTPTKFLFPYYEATILLRCDYEGQIGWYSHVMPVSTEAAMIGGHRLGFPKYVADEWVLRPTEDGWFGAAVHEGRNRITLRFSAKPVSGLEKLTPLEQEFADGRGDAANLVGPVILLVPPGVGPEVNVIPCSPPPLADRQVGSVRINLSEPYDGLVPDGTVAAGLYQRFTLPGGGGPSWTVIGLFFAALVGLGWWIVRSRKARRAAAARPS